MGRFQEPSFYGDDRPAPPHRSEAASGDPASSSAAAAKHRTASQSGDGYLPDGVPEYSVTIANGCLGCTVHNVHVACGEFASTELVDPSDFRRLAVGDCLVRDGGPMAPGDVVTFQYSNSFQYPMHVASVACGSS
ncbi:hypothetical protein ACP4OV_002949 [Aristida adscensionis]